jgi:hypothetical protein
VTVRFFARGEAPTCTRRVADMTLTPWEFAPSERVRLFVQTVFVGTFPAQAELWQYWYVICRHGAGRSDARQMPHTRKSRKDGNGQWNATSSMTHVVEAAVA